MLQQPPDTIPASPRPRAARRGQPSNMQTANSDRLEHSSNRQPTLAPTARQARADSAGESASLRHARAVATVDCQAWRPRGSARPAARGAPTRPERPRAATRHRVAAREPDRPSPRPVAEFHKLLKDGCAIPTEQTPTSTSPRYARRCVTSAQHSRPASTAAASGRSLQPSKSMEAHDESPVWR